MKDSLISAALFRKTRGQTTTYPLHHFGTRKELKQLLAGEERFLDWKCRCGEAVCLICVIMLGSRKCLAKVTDGV